MDIILNDYSARLKNKYAKHKIKTYIAYEKMRTRFFNKQRMKILFSDKKEDWARTISLGFQNTNHEIAFDEIDYEHVRNYDLIVPLTIDDLKKLNNYPQIILNNPIPIPSIKCIDLCDDKLTFNKTLTDNGYSDYLPKMKETLRYPYVLKKRIDEYGQNCHIISDFEEEKRLLDILQHPDYFCQEMIPGSHEYATHILFKDHKIICSINIEYTFNSEFPIKGKDIGNYVSICRCPHLALFSSILKSIGFEGLCCVNYKNYDGRPLILEINPRFGGSLSRFFFSFIRHIN